MSSLDGQKTKTDSNRTQKPVALDEILSVSNSIVLLDGSTALVGDFGKAFCREIYEKSNFSGIDMESVREELKEVKKFIYLFGEPNVWAIKERTKETKAYLHNLGKKLSSFQWAKKRFAHNMGKGQSEEELFRELHQATFELYGLIKGKDIRKNNELSINPKTLEGIADIVKSLDKTVGLKRDTGYKYGKNEAPSTRDTDERMVATAIYLSVFSDKKPAIITSDGDFSRLLGVVPGIIGATNLKNNSLFVDRFKNNPVSLYFCRKGNFSYLFSTSDLDYNHEFLIRNAGHSENRAMKEELEKRLKELVPVKENQPPRISDINGVSGIVPYA